jgi:hypothetical protein
MTVAATNTRASTTLKISTAFGTHPCPLKIGYRQNGSEIELDDKKLILTTLPRTNDPHLYSDHCCGSPQSLISQVHLQ